MNSREIEANSLATYRDVLLFKKEAEFLEELEDILGERIKCLNKESSNIIKKIEKINSDNNKFDYLTEQTPEIPNIVSNQIKAALKEAEIKKQFENCFIVKSNHVISINIANYRKFEGKKAELPSSIENLTDLIELRLHKFNIIPKSIKKLSKLKFLSIISYDLNEISDSIFDINSLDELEILAKLKELPERIGDLTNLKKLILHRNNLEKLPEAIGRLESLKELDLHGNKIKNLPETLGNLENLENIDITENPLEGLPKSFGNIKKIKELSLASKALKNLPESFGKLENLERLEITRSLNELPQSFGELKKLKSLKINCSGLNNLPSSFGNLESLSELDLRCHTLKELPYTFGNLKALSNLNLVCVELKSLPTSFSQLQELKEFNLTSTDFHKLPEDFGKLINLQKLKLNRIDLEELPSSFGNLKNLEYLNISGNKLRDLPESFKNLNKLKELEINRNPFETLPAPVGHLKNIVNFKIWSQNLSFLPETIDNMEKLETLEIYGNLKNFPESFGNLKNLKLLKISRNKLERLPNSFGNLDSLIELDLSNNHISKLPDSFSKLKNIEILNLNYNQIVSLPDSFGNLKSLKVLRLRRNQLESLPENLKDMELLETLDLDNNNINSLPNDLSGLKSLEALELSNNKVKEIPESIGNLTSLKKLNLSNNQLEFLPKTLQKLENLEWLNVSDNNLKIFPDIAQQLKELKNVDLHGNLNLSINNAIFNLYNLENLNFSFWSEKQTSSNISPKFIESDNPKLKREIKRILLNSLEIIENVDEFIFEFLNGKPIIRDYILRFGIHVQDTIDVLMEKIQDKSQIILLEKLSNDINEQESKKNIKIQFLKLCEHFGTLTYPMGILYLSSMLKKKLFKNIEYYELFWFEKIKQEQQSLRKTGIPASHFSYLRFFSDEEIVKYEKEYEEYLKNRNPHVIFLGPITTNYLPFFVSILPKIRELCPNAFIFAGGPHFGINYSFDEDLINNRCQALDGLIAGEAEETIVEIMDEFYEIYSKHDEVKKKETLLQQLSNIRGIFIRDKHFVERSHISDLNMIPFPDYDILLDFIKSNPYRINNYSLAERRNPVIGMETGVVEDYSRPGNGYFMEDVHFFDWYYNEHSDIPYAIIIGSRECPYQCTFCASHKKPRRLRTAENVFKEIKLLYEELDIKLFIFFDPLFTTFSSQEIERVEKLSNLIKRNELDIKYSIEIRADIINKILENTIIKLIESGCSQFNLGLEKGSDEALQRFQKSMTIKQHQKAIDKIRNASIIAYNHKEDCNSIDVLINGTFILGGPKETKEDIKDTLTHGFKLDLNGLRFFPLEIHPGTEIYKQAVNNHIIQSGIEPYLDANNYPIYETSNLSKEYLFQIQKMAENVFEEKNQIRQEFYDLKKNIKYMDDAYNKVEEYIKKVESQFRRFINSVLELIKKI